MKGIIDNIMTFYDLQAKALGILIANTQNALEASDRERIADQQAERIENFVKDLVMDLNNRITRFYFLKEHKQRKNESMNSDQIKNLVDFANFTKTLTKDVRLLLTRFQKTHGQTFEKKFDKEIKQMETYVKGRLKGFDKTLEESLTGTHNTWKERLKEYAGKGV